MFRPAAEIDAVQHDRSRICLQRTADRIEQRALTGTVAAEHTDEISVIQMQGYMIQGLSLIHI